MNTEEWRALEMVNIWANRSDVFPVFEISLKDNWLFKAKCITMNYEVYSIFKDNITNSTEAKGRKWKHAVLGLL